MEPSEFRAGASGRPDASLDMQLTELQRLASLGILAGAVLHEINNALTPALSYSQLALANPDDHALTRKALERAIAGIRHASRVADSTLGLVRSAEHGPAATPPAIQLLPIVEAAKDSMLPLAAKAGVGIETVCSGELVAVINPVELQQVLINLISNSIRAASRGGLIRVGCSTWNNGASGVGAEIEVVDDGQGVEPSIRARLFQPMVSAAHAGHAHGNATGHGLGLMISRRLIEAAAGQLTFDAAHTPGARFVIRIP